VPSAATLRTHAHPARRAAAPNSPNSAIIFGDHSTVTTPTPEVHGLELDAQTRCLHYRSALDIIAIKIACCGLYYACKDCHEVLAGHPIQTWPHSAWNTPAILCGACQQELTIHEYMASGYQCPRCNAAFNPGCRNHYHFYFAADDQA
jgi:uncharacterized CHY-type Zn-finger protein